ncbi:MAG: AsmA family protein, partial [Mariprofundaceae bacterium]|nr:AsmA family protein [Mariprofundaceae bacterium]
ASPMLAGLTADMMVLNNGSLIWNDEQQNQHISMTSLHLQLDDVQLDKPIQVHFSGKLNQDEIKLDAQVGPLGDLGNLDIYHLPVQLHVQSFGLQLAPWEDILPPFPAMLGDIKQAKVRFDMQLEQRPDGAHLMAGQFSLLAAMNLALDWKMEMPTMNHLDMHDLSLKINDKHVLSMQGKVKQLTKAFNYQLRLQSDVLQRTWLTQLFPDMKAMYAGNHQAWKTIKIGASLAGNSEHVEIRDLQFKLNDEVIQASGNVAFANSPDIRLRIAGKNLHLEPWLPASSDVSSPASTAGTATKDGYAEQAASNPDSQASVVTSETAVKPNKQLEPDLRFLKTWRVALQLQMEHLFVQGLDIAHIHMILNGQKGMFTLDPLQFELAGGSLLEKANVNVNTYPVQWNESLNIIGLQLLPVLQAVAESDMLDGSLKLNTNFSAIGLLPESIKHGLEGTAQFSLLNGRVKGFDIAGGLRNITSFGQENASKFTDFAQLQGSVRAHHGIIKNNDLFMASPLFRLSGKGTVRLPDMSMDYHVRPKLIASLVGQGDQNTNRGGLMIPLHIYGPFAQLTVKPEITADNVWQEAQRLGKKNPKLGGVLKKLNNKPVQKLLNENLPPQQKEKINQALKGLFGL